MVRSVSLWGLPWVPGDELKSAFPFSSLLPMGSHFHPLPLPLPPLPPPPPPQSSSCSTPGPKAEYELHTNPHFPDYPSLPNPLPWTRFETYYHDLVILQRKKGLLKYNEWVPSKGPVLVRVSRGGLFVSVVLPLLALLPHWHFAPAPNSTAAAATAAAAAAAAPAGHHAAATDDDSAATTAYDDSAAAAGTPLSLSPFSNNSPRPPGRAPSLLG